jgi:hypothetical protein
MRDERTHKREQEARDATRRDAILEKRKEFQRETLLALQEQVFLLMRTNSQLHDHLCADLRKHGRGYATEAPSEPNQQSMMAQQMTFIAVYLIEADITTCERSWRAAQNTARRFQPSAGATSAGT